VGGNTALAMPDDAGVLRIDESTGRGIALATDANGRYTKLDPRTGAQLALAEAYRNVAAAGATPLAITDCLNFGSPEDPGPMWQLVEAIEGLAEACEALEVPVTGGNVSLYNSTGEPGRIDSAIHPTPVVGVLGVFEDVAKRVPSGWQGEGQSVLLLGTTREELSGSAWADVLHQHLGGLPPQVDLEAERSLATVLIASSEQGLATAAHDLSEGGLAQALVESVVRFGTGASVDLTELLERDGVDLLSALFSESQARALVAVPAAQEEQPPALASEHGFQLLRLGSTGCDALDVAGLGSVGVDELRELREGALPRYFGCPPASPDRDQPPRRRSPPSSCPAGSVVVPGQSRPYSSCASAVFAAMLSAAGAGSGSCERSRTSPVPSWTLHLLPPSTREPCLTS